MPCVVESIGDEVVVDTSHPAYPGVSRLPPSIKHSRPGVGSELKAMLRKVGITATPTCSCNAHAKVMDANGPEWCEEHMEEIIAWMKAEASKRGLPFWDRAGRMLVKMAIRRAKRGDLGSDA